MPAAPIAVLLDLDGTLADTDSSVAAGVLGALAEAHRLTGVTEDTLRTANERAASHMWTSHAQDWMLGRISPLQFSTDIYSMTLELAGASQRFAPELVDAHALAAKAGLRTFDDVEPFLQSLAAVGARIAIVTNGASETQRSTLTTLELQDVADAVIVSAEVGCEKPDPRIFELALSALDARADETWHIGDSLASDVVGAAAAGVRPVWLNRDQRAASTQLPATAITISTLSELVPFPS